jgi:hypothetical protein
MDRSRTLPSGDEFSSSIDHRCSFDGGAFGRRSAGDA